MLIFGLPAYNSSLKKTYSLKASLGRGGFLGGGFLEKLGVITDKRPPKRHECVNHPVRYTKNYSLRVIESRTKGMR